MNRAKRLRLAPVFIVTLGVAACGGNATPTSPSTTTAVVSPAGTWSGTISAPISGEGSVQLSLSGQPSDTLTGTWSATFNSGERFSGPAFASLFRTDAYGITLTAQPPGCAVGSEGGGTALLAFSLTNVAPTSSRLTAAVSRISCNGFSFGGSVNLSKQ